MIIVDTSFVFKLLNEEISIDLFNSDEKFVAPDLFDYEIANVLWKFSKFGGLDVSVVKKNLLQIKMLEIELQHPDTFEVFLLAQKTGLTAYDASYLLLAQKYDCTLATYDKELKKVAKNLGIDVL